VCVVPPSDCRTGTQSAMYDRIVDLLRSLGRGPAHVDHHTSTTARADDTCR
jgi:hypothetical protein